MPSTAKCDTKEKRREAVFVFCLMAAGYFYCSVQRVSATVVLPHMASAYGFSASLVGFLSSLFFYSYGFTQNVWGAVNDRVGPMKSCAVGMAVAGVGSLIMLVSRDPWCIGLSRIVTGLGLGCMFTGIYLYAALAFPVEMYPYMVGWILVVGNLGTVAAVAPLGMLMDVVGYDGLYLSLAVWAFVVSGLLWALKGRSPAAAAPEQGEAGKAGGLGGLGGMVLATVRDIAHGFRLLIGYRPVVVVAFVWVMVSASMQTLGGLWGVTWISVSSGAELADARFWATFINVGLVVGSPLGARVTYLSKGGRGGVAWLMGALCAAWCAYLYGAWVNLSAPAMGGLGFLVGVLTGAGMVYCSSTLKSLVHLSHAGLIIGTGNTFIYMAVIVCQWGSGAIIDRFPSALAGTYLNEGYILAFAAITLVLALSFLSIFTVKSFKAKDEA